MGKTITRTLGSLGLPLVVVFAMIALSQSKVWTESLGSVSEVLPHVITLAAVGIGLRFNRSRVVLSALVIAAANWAINDSGAQGPALLLGISVLLPATLAGLAVLKERGLTTIWGLAASAAAAVPVALIAWLVRPDGSRFVALLDRPMLPEELVGVSKLPELAVVVAAVSAVVALVALLFRRSALNSALACALAAVVAGLEIHTRGGASAPLFASAGLLLVVAVIQESYGLAYIDELTKIPGRRALNESLLGLGRHYTVAMLDIDHFKKFNDKYGHDVGDQVLKLVASRLKKVGGGGKAYRYGGEEFTIVFSGKSLEESLDPLEAVRSSVQNARLTLRAKDRPKKRPKVKPARKPTAKQVSVTISIGVASRDKKAKRPGAVMEAADKALYRAKKKGRNQVCR